MPAIFCQEKQLKKSNDNGSGVNATNRTAKTGLYQPSYALTRSLLCIRFLPTRSKQTPQRLTKTPRASASCIFVSFSFMPFCFRIRKCSDEVVVWQRRWSDESLLRIYRWFTTSMMMLLLLLLGIFIVWVKEEACANTGADSPQGRGWL